MSHLCEQLVEAARYLEAVAMTREQLSQLHHFSLKGRQVSFGEAYRYFGANKDLGQKNRAYAQQLIFVAAEHKQGAQDISMSITQALYRWPL